MSAYEYYFKKHDWDHTGERIVNMVEPEYCDTIHLYLLTPQYTCAVINKEETRRERERESFVKKLITAQEIQNLEYGKPTVLARDALEH